MAKATLASLMVKFGADNFEFQQKVKEIDKGLKNLDKEMKTIGKNMSVAFTAPLTALAGVSLKNWDVQVKSIAKVEQAIKATGGAAKLTSKELQAAASDLQGSSLFGDERILNDVTAKMLTFTNIAGDNFKKAQQAALDMATVMERDVSGIVTALGRALNDPVKNMSALSRMGVQFSKEQQATIKTFAETNRLAEAQGVILDALATRFGGQASAVAQAGLGPLIQLKNQWGDFLEEIGAIIAPVVMKIVDGLKGFVSWLQRLSPETKKVIVIVGALAAAIGPLALAIGGVIRLIPTLVAGWTAMTGPAGIAIAAVTALAAAFIYLDAKKQKALRQQEAMFSEWALGDLENQLTTNQQKQDEIYKKIQELQGRSQRSFDSAGTQIRELRREAKDLISEEILLSKAIDTKRKAQEEDNRIKQEAATFNAELQDMLEGISTETEKATGYINELKQKISDLAKQRDMLPEGSLTQVMTINAEIEELQGRIDALQKIGQNVEINIDIKRSAPDKIDVPDNLFDSSDFDKQFEESWNSASNKLLIFSSRASTLMQNFYSKFKISKEDIETISQNMMAPIFAFADKINSAVNDLTQNLASGLGDMFADITIGDGLKNSLRSIADMIGDFIIKLGITTIMASEAVIAFKAAINSLLAPLGPAGGLAAGIGLIAIGAVIKALANKRAENSAPRLANGGLAFGPTYAMVGDNRNAGLDPEVIAPLSKLKQYLQPVSPFAGGDVVFRISGDQLVGILNRQDKQNRHF